MFRKKIEETDVKREALINEIAVFLGTFKPKNVHHHQVLQKLKRLIWVRRPLDDRKKKRSPFFPEHRLLQVILYMRPQKRLLY